jgi:hypothetical protein
MLLRASVRTIAVYQLLSAAAFAWTIAWVLWSGQRPLLTLTVCAVFVLFNLFAGIESLRGKRRGYLAGFLNELLQIPSLTVPGFAYDYIGLGQVSLAAQIKPREGVWFLVGFSGDVAPGRFLLWFGGASAGANIAIDLISTVFAAFLWRTLYGYNGTHESPVARVQ